MSDATSDADSEMHRTGDVAISGKRVWFYPNWDNGGVGSLDWDCGTDEIPARYLPSSCRDGPP